MRSSSAANAPASPPVELRIEHDPDGAVGIRLAGRLDVDAAGVVWEEAVAAARGARAGLRVDAAGLDYCDGAGAALLVALEGEARSASASFRIEGLREDFAELLALVRPGGAGPAAGAGTRPGLLDRVGRTTLGVMADLGRLVSFVGELTVFLGRSLLLHPRELRFRDAVVVADRAGIGAVPIVALVGFLLGLILAFQGAIPMQRFGAQIFVADLLGIAMLRELGPLMAAILITARSASAFAAEIGTMKVNEEVDALTTMGLEPVRFLVVPRVLAALAVVPALTMITTAAALIGGLVVFVQLGYPSVTFWSRVLESVTVTDLVSGLAKSLVFGVIVAAIGCLRGLETGTGAQAVGLSTTSAVVSGIILIAIADGVFAVLFYVLGI